MIDWTKPIRTRNGGYNVRVERILLSGFAIISWETVNGTQSGVASPDALDIYNLRPEPREWWFNLFDRAEDLRRYRTREAAAKGAKECDYGIFGESEQIRVREVLED
jgi:hypothetical protein